jgi:hypothetical protein
MSALIPGLTGGIYGEKNKFFDFATYFFWDFKYVVQNVRTCSNKTTSKGISSNF